MNTISYIDLDPKRLLSDFFFQHELEVVYGTVLQKVCALLMDRI